MFSIDKIVLVDALPVCSADTITYLSKYIFMEAKHFLVNPYY